MSFECDGFGFRSLVPSVRELNNILSGVGGTFCFCVLEESLLDNFDSSSVY